jgi:hypothetical protein
MDMIVRTMTTPHATPPMWAAISLRLKPMRILLD